MMTERQESADPDDLGLETFRRQPEEEGISLDRLSDAFAQLLGRGEDPYEQAEVESESPESTAEISPSTILEAMLFVGGTDNEALTSKYVASLMRGVRPAEIDQLVDSLNTRYAQDGCPYWIVSTGLGYRLELRPEFDAVRRRFHGRQREARLSQAAVEVLAIVAYCQPITAQDLNRRRGKPSGSILTHLVRRGVLRMERPAEQPRRPVYRTTERFLKLFGLENLADLPQSPELSEE